LHLIAGLDAADGGEITLAGASVADLGDADRRRCGATVSDWCSSSSI